MCSSPRALPPVIEVPSSRRVVQVCFPCTHFTYWLLRYCLPGSRVWCSSPGASPPVMEIPSSRRGAWWRAGPRTSPQLWRYCLPGSRVWCVRPGAPPPVTEIPSSRRIWWRVGPRASPRLWRCRLPDGLPSAHAYVFRQSSYDRCSCVRNRSLNRLVSRKKACVYVNLDLKY